MDDRIIDSVKNADKVLVGIGESWEGQGDKAITGYEALKKLIDGKDYYIVSVCSDGLIERAGFEEKRVVTPNDETDDKWNEYNQWLARTLNKNLCILELGVGLKYPTVIRWPFEKVVFVNEKAHMYRIHEKFYQTTDEIGQKCTGIKANPLEYIC